MRSIHISPRLESPFSLRMSRCIAVLPVISMLQGSGERMPSQEEGVRALFGASSSYTARPKPSVDRGIAEDESAMCRRLSGSNRPTDAIAEPSGTLQ